MKFSIKTLLSRVQKLQRKRRLAHHDTAVADDGGVLCVRKGMRVTTPALTSLRTKLRRTSIWRDYLRRTGFSLIVTRARLSTYVYMYALNGECS